MDTIDPVLLRIEQLIRLSRFKEIQFILNTNTEERMRDIAAALRRLQSGGYLIGTGPSTVGIIPLHTDEIVLGRPPTILEPPAERTADYCAVDTLYFVPREISRTHAKVIQRTDGRETRHVLIDMNSTCGTFVNAMAVHPGGAGITLRHGDVISLGPSQTSTYVYYKAGRIGCRDSHDAVKMAADLMDKR